MSYPTNEPDVDFFVLCTLKIDANIRNSLIFLRKMATFSCLAGPIDRKIHASMYFISICPLAHIILQVFFRCKWKDISRGKDHDLSFLCHLKRTNLQAPITSYTFAFFNLRVLKTFFIFYHRYSSLSTNSIAGCTSTTFFFFIK